MDKELVKNTLKAGFEELKQEGKIYARMRNRHRFDDKKPRTTEEVWFALDNPFSPRHAPKVHVSTDESYLYINSPTISFWIDIKVNKFGNSRYIKKEYGREYDIAPHRFFMFSLFLSRRHIKEEIITLKRTITFTREIDIANLLYEREEEEGKGKNIIKSEIFSFINRLNKLKEKNLKTIYPYYRINFLSEGKFRRYKKSFMDPILEIGLEMIDLHNKYTKKAEQAKTECEEVGA